MATETVEVPDGFEKPETGNPDREEAIELSPGEEITGVILNINSGMNGDDPWHLLEVKRQSGEKVRWFAAGEAKQYVTNGDYEAGTLFWAAKLTETDDYTDETGEIHEFHPVVSAADSS